MEVIPSHLEAPNKADKIESIMNQVPAVRYESRAIYQIMEDGTKKPVLEYNVRAPYTT